MKTKKAIPRILVLFLALSLLLPAFHSISAATSSSRILTAPEKFYISAQPGQKILKKVTVANPTNASIQLKIITKDFRLKNETGQLEFFNDTAGMSSWIIPEFLQIGIKPVQTKEVNFIINIPADAAAKGYQGAILFEQTSNNTTKTVSGAVILLNVGQTALISPKIVSAETAAINNSFPVSLQMQFRNTGDQNLKTNGTLTLRDWRGKIVEELKNQKIFLVSKSEQKFSWNILTPTSPIGFYRAQVQLDDPAKAGSKITAGTWFIIFPWKTSLWVLAGIIVLVAIFELGRRWGFKKIRANFSRSVPIKFKE